jgi:transcriptional regulator with XRE-family HTH domain
MVLAEVNRLDSTLDMPEALLSATTGVSELDKVLGGLYWGDNVVWSVDEPTDAEPFFSAFATSATNYGFAAFVNFAREPDELSTRFPGVEVVDARPGTHLAQPGPLLTELRSRCEPTRRDLIIFDTFEAMASRWGTETATRFFVRTCPCLLELGAIAYWSIRPSVHAQGVRRELEEITQCVISVGEGRVRIAKAEGRAVGAEGSVFRYRLGDSGLVLEPAPLAARLGAALRAVRVNRSLTQRDVGRLAGVSASAISQAERGQRGLSLETLLELAGKLNLTLDQLLRGESAPGYLLGRRHDPHARAEGRFLPLLDNPETGMRAYVVRLPSRETASPGFTHKGIELVAVGTGLVQVVLSTGRPVLRDGETLLAERSGVEALRNLSDREALVFWILRDEGT